MRPALVLEWQWQPRSRIRLEEELVTLHQGELFPDSVEEEEAEEEAEEDEILLSHVVGYWWAI
ncbi:hypothetical protein N7530_002367 [Penicillium desertorum]|uniref:Uncharacterized protein n=1 Tax=Penicillium desertorum TaxID=1303715 RepID=A0A9W9WDS0_9EURO|nr:hypothetical protein N7530_012796 [Penicillium desertorum]KAJ5483121.1 hypothetical protein N7530_002367 [Penicillium desertorum]